MLNSLCPPEDVWKNISIQKYPFCHTCFLVSQTWTLFKKKFISFNEMSLCDKITRTTLFDFLISLARRHPKALWQKSVLKTWYNYKCLGLIHSSFVHTWHWMNSFGTNKFGTSQRYFIVTVLILCCNSLTNILNVSTVLHIWFVIVVNL
jgi:hypothetical protein